MITLALLAAAQGAASDPLLEQLAAVPAADAAACSHTITVDERQGGEARRLVYLFDAETEETSLIDGPPEMLLQQAAEQGGEADEDDQEAEEVDDTGERVSFGPLPYDDVARSGLPYQRVGTEGGLVVFRAAPLPKGTYEASGRDMSKRSEARLWVRPGETPRVVRHAYGLTKEFRVPMIARVRTLRQETAYEEVGGAMRPVLFTITFDADVMGKTQDGRTTIARSDWDCSPAD